MKKRSGPKPKKPVANPYLPALLSLHDRWKPEQIMHVFTRLDYDATGNEYALSRELVLELAKLPQNAVVQYPLKLGSLTAGPAQFPGGMSIGEFLGNCGRCGKVKAEFQTQADGNIVPVCGDCYALDVTDEDLKEIAEQDEKDLEEGRKGMEVKDGGSEPPA